MASKAAVFDPISFQPIVLGNTWRTDEDGQWLLPEYSLGFGIAAWAATWLVNEDGEPWMFTPEQFRFLLWYYEIDLRGRFVYSDAVLQRCKGWGKDPVGVVIALAELLGPCRFSDWDENGDPVGKDNPVAWVQIAAVSAQQAKGN